MAEQKTKGNHHQPREVKIRAVELLALGRTLRSVGKELGVSHCAVLDWTRDPEMAQMLAEARAANLKNAERIYSASVVRLVRKEIDIALGRCEATPQQVRALHQALSRAGVGEPERLQISGSLSGASDAEIERAIQEWLTGKDEPGGEEESADPLAH